MKRKQTEHHPQGVVVIEAALVLPVLILITLAGLQYGWLFLKQQEITNVARHYVRYATRPEVVDFGPARTKMLAELAKMGIASDAIDGAQTTIAWVTGGEAPPDGVVGDALYAQVSVYADKVDLINFFPTPYKLTAHATMSKEGE